MDQVLPNPAPGALHHPVRRLQDWLPDGWSVLARMGAAPEAGLRACHLLANAARGVILLDLTAPGTLRAEAQLGRTLDAAGFTRRFRDLVPIWYLQLEPERLPGFAARLGEFGDADLPAEIGWVPAFTAAIRRDPAWIMEPAPGSAPRPPPSSNLAAPVAAPRQRRSPLHPATLVACIGTVFMLGLAAGQALGPRGTPAPSEPPAADAAHQDGTAPNGMAALREAVATPGLERETGSVLAGSIAAAPEIGARPDEGNVPPATVQAETPNGPLADPETVDTVAAGTMSPGNATPDAVRDGPVTASGVAAGTMAAGVAADAMSAPGAMPAGRPAGRPTASADETADALARGPRAADEAAAAAQAAEMDAAGAMPSGAEAAGVAAAGAVAAMSSIAAGPNRAAPAATARPVAAAPSRGAPRRPASAVDRRCSDAQFRWQQGGSLSWSEMAYLRDGCTTTAGRR